MSKGLMELDFFKEVFDQLDKSLISVNIFSWGEPLLNKDFIKMIKYAKSHNPNVRISTSTNLNVKNDEMLRDLVASGIDEIIVSCDGASYETYSKYRKGGDFDLVIANMKTLSKAKREQKKDTGIIWNFIVFKHNEHEIEKAKNSAHSIGVDFRVGLMRTSMKDEILKPHKETIMKDKEWIPDNPAYSAYDKEKCIPKKKMKTCHKPWREIAINWNGLVFPCCIIYGDKYNLGNAKKTPIKEIWNGRMYIKARKDILSKKNSQETICAICKSHGYMHM